MTTKKIEHAALKGELLTLGEVAAWVQDAMRAGASGGEIVGATISFGGKLQKIRIEVDADAKAPVEGSAP
ncbi:hypothetical protein N4G70_28905 [Streptomyces sp. ASQP_92]|uniref:hypothetical protein n=1 Tax=Streptomyces sp. ASQP_92 TaxID=2979116 RepID=UPI0021C13AA4|nr:hypothetical protein [Streptomyces sp. ASQP_92]MCT9092860.1 hypothetical protein [Streptomyces sp. ASQP_92]